MDEGYFVPRTEILDWLNNLLKVKVYPFSSISQKLNNSAQEQCIAKWLMLSIQAK